MSATGGNLDVAGKAAGGRKLIAVVYADMVGYSRLIGLDDAGTLHRLRTLRRALIDPAIREHGGRVVQTGGDSLLVAFDSIDGAVRCAVRVQQQVPIYDGDQPADRRIRFRIGINIGDVIPHGTDLHGDGVNIAARLEAECPVGGICVSRTVRDHVHGRLDLPFEAIGPLTLKNIARPVEAFVVRLDPAAEALAPHDAPDAAKAGGWVRLHWPLVAAIAGLLLIGVAGAGWWLSRDAGIPRTVSATTPTSDVRTAASSATAPPLQPPNVSLSTAPRLSIVVLPFDNLGGDAADGYLVAGVSDTLTTMLSQIAGTFVISRATANSYRDKAQDIRGIGRELGVRYVIRGSVQRFGSMLRVNAELDSTETGAQLWSDTFDQKTADLALGQEEIVFRMRSALRLRLTDIEAVRSLKERPTNPDAFDLFLRARAMYFLPQTKETLAQSVELYKRALALDPHSVLALAGAVSALTNEIFIGGISYDVGMDQAIQYLERAKALEPDAELVLVAQAAVLDFQGEGLDYRRTRSELKVVSQRLVELYPNDPESYFRLGVVGRQEGRYDEAAQYFARTIQLNPHNPSIKNLYWNMAYCRILAGHDQEGLDWASRTLAASGLLRAAREESLLWLQAVAHFRTGDIYTAKRLTAELNDRYPFDTWRGRSPNNPDSETDQKRFQSIQDALKVAGNRDHLDPDVNFGVTPEGVLHEFSGRQNTDHRARRDDHKHRAALRHAAEAETTGDRHDGCLMASLCSGCGRP